MSISVFLRSLRKRREINQQQLADSLGVNIMTISRLESKEDVTLTPRMVEKIANYISDDDLATLDPSDPQERKILRYVNNEGHSKWYDQSRAWFKDIERQIDALVGKVGYSRIQPDWHDIATHNTLIYKSRDNRKIWKFRVAPFDISSSKTNLLEVLGPTVGFESFIDQEMAGNKVTIVIPNSFDEIKSQLQFPVAKYLPFDISILHFRDDGTIQQETSLHSNTDGRGIFDLDVDDTAVSVQALKDYVAWTRAVGNIITWEKAK